MCCLPLIFKPSLGRRKKLPQKVGRREKLPQKVGRRKIYRPVPLPSTDALLINRIICDSSWLKSKTVWWFEDACTKAVYNVTLFSINKTIIYQVTMYVQYISVLRQIWYFCAYILPGCCEDFFIKLNRIIKIGFGEINLVVSLQCYCHFKSSIIKCKSNRVLVVLLLGTRFFLF